MERHRKDMETQTTVIGYTGKSLDAHRQQTRNALRFPLRATLLSVIIKQAATPSTLKLRGIVTSWAAGR